ncbi:Chaperone protein ClpB1 [Apostasia shenzhenica]|uniref:Chaperone protein ClpB1 n=1 Tax=Apostasia shenzhenica TaxID=1088818 RepID=A0A2I0A3E6_9ASPA|nr:Chaperone protein ClpB1 [Apostasia shenzhenica]
MFVRIFEGQHFPAKAIGLVVEACANVRIQQDSRPMDIDDLHRCSIVHTFICLFMCKEGV